MSYKLTTGAEPRGGVLDMSMLKPGSWRESPFPRPGRHFGAVFFGDDESGPFAALNAIEPMEEPYAPSPGHGHRSDSWRISIRGALRVGAQSYQPGSFRFQEAGLLYGADDNGWSPEGAQSVVMMADRRGASAIPAEPKNAEIFREAAAAFDRWAGRPERKDYSIVASVATTLGMPRFGRIDGSFAQAESWREHSPGVRMEIGLCGDRASGPVVLLIAAEQGREAMPELRLPTEVMHVVVGGAALSDGRTLAAADVRLVEADAGGPSFSAGPPHLWLASVVGDRRALDQAACADAPWLAEVRAAVAQLAASLGSQCGDRMRAARTNDREDRNGHATHRRFRPL